MTTQKDVAEYANVSFITVSRVINNKGNVKPETRKRVLEAIQKLNYYPNTFAQGLYANRANTIAVLPSLRDDAMMEETSYYRRLIAGIERCCSQHGYDVLLSTKRGAPQSFDYLKPFYLRKADGLVLIGVDPDVERLQKINADRIPCCFIGEDGDKSRAQYIYSDNRWGTQLVTEYLLRCGHRNIAYLHADNASRDLEERFACFLAVMQKNSIPFPDHYLFKGNYLEDSGRDTIRRIAAMKERPTALISATDLMALGVLDEARKVGLAIPDDISIAGFDGHEFGRLMNPPLATVLQDLEGMGYKATELVIEQIEDENKPGGRTIFPVVFEPRGSIRNLVE